MNKITYIINSLNRGGAETHLSGILPCLKEKGWDITIYLLEDEGELSPYLRHKDIKVISLLKSDINSNKKLKIINYTNVTINLFFYLIKEKPQIIHFFLPKSYLIGAPLSLLANIKIRIMSRRSLNNYHSKYPTFISKFECFLHKRMTKILGNSQSVIHQLENEEGVDRSKTELIYNGLIDPQITDIKEKIDFQTSEEKITFAVVANLIPYKGHLDLIKAFGKLNDRTDWNLLLIGDDPHGFQKEIQNLCEKNDLKNHVTFLGKRSDVHEVLSHCDVGILPSHEEGFSNAILEYMAASLPVIATNVGGNAEAVTDGKTGLIVDPHQPDQLYQAIVKLLEDRALISAMGSAGLARQQEFFTLEKCVNQYDKLYRSLISLSS